MIIIKLKGGLGNQMFQYAFGRSLAYINKKKLKLDISNFEKAGSNTPRHYQLDIFNIEAEIINSRKIKKINWLDKFKPYYKRLLIKERFFHFDPRIIKKYKYAIFDGYWQSEKYFSNIKDIIAEELKLKNKYTNKIKDRMIVNKIKETNSVSMHIRRGDYANNKQANLHHGLCPLDYYYKATEIISNEKKEPIFFIFSDDIDWVKKNLKLSYPSFFISGNKDYEDLFLMSLCKHNIIANSSFSWWAAWLNNNKGKIVIAPKKWFNNPKQNTKDLIPKSWIKI